MVGKALLTEIPRSVGADRRSPRALIKSGLCRLEMSPETFGQLLLPCGAAVAAEAYAVADGDVVVCVGAAEWAADDECRPHGPLEGPCPLHRLLVPGHVASAGVGGP